MSSSERRITSEDFLDSNPHSAAHSRIFVCSSRLDGIEKCGDNQPRRT